MAQLLSQVAVGSIVKLKENGKLVKFYVGVHNYESSLNGTGRTLVVRKDCYDNRVWDSGNVNAYASSDLDSWFNSTYKNKLDADIRSLIGTTKIRYTPGNGNNTVGTLKRAVFALSATELGESKSWINVEGSALPIASTLQVAYRNGSTTTQWTRSPHTNYDDRAFFLGTNGYVSDYFCTSTRGSRPAFTLPSSLYVSDDGSVFQNTAPSTPASISVPSSIDGGSTITVSWGTSTDAEGNLEGYIVERQVDGGSWSQIYQGTATSTTNTVTFGTNTVAYRVKAYDAAGLESGWKTSSTVTVTNNRAPGAPGSLTVPDQANKGGSVAISWTASTDQDGNLSGYTLQRSVNGGGFTQVYQGASTSYTDTAPTNADTLQYRVQAYDTQGATSGWTTSNQFPVYGVPALTVPQMVMQGQQATISWSAIEGADSYTLQRKSSADADWTQVYSGANLSYSETVGTWTSVQYRVQAVFDGTAGGWAESASIPVVPSSALVISGTDGDLGTVVNDIPYSISTDTGNQITATITVNSAVIFSGNVGNSTSDTIPVLDLVNGEGTIVIEASVTASGGPVSAVRTWTYTKSLITFPNAGSVAQLTKEGENIFPKTLAECVRLPGGKTLDEVTAFPCQIYAGSYVGTGAYGQSNPNTLTFPFEPKVVFLNPANITVTMAWPGSNAANGNSALTVRWAGNSVSWYSTTNASAQLNVSGHNYYYVVFG